MRQRIAELTALFAAERPYVRVAKDGPYLVVGAKRLQTHLGVPIEHRPLVALCRCGASASKPFCDGSHVRTGFTGSKAEDRVPDRRDTYVGTSITVLDNRGLCQHSGYCTDRLSTVFRAGTEPFVSPSGGRLDDIVHAVRACPSGALSFAIDGWEVRAHVDPAGRPPEVEVSQHGPYRVTGGLTLLDDGNVRHAAPQGASAEHYTLCRCGQSKNKPFCSGRHWDVNFSDPAPSAEPSIFEWMGGYHAILRLTRLFYRKYVPADPLLAPLFGSMSPDHPERVASWLAEVFGGPSYYGDNYGGYNRMLSEHIGKMLTEAQRERWAGLMYQAANEAMLPADADFRAAFCSYVEWGTRLAVENSQTESKPPLNMPMPHWGWVNGATPWSRVNALAPAEDDEPAVLPADDEPVSFARHIRTLFRERDCKSMRFAMDLWSYEDVRAHASAILARVSDGTMPCDGAWPQEKVRALQRWITEGMAA
ncbi:MAG TPA: CDGSH iron-sulfur domain-containing protein [Pseudonocardiaceae bacterium]|nr:CDGSH iron-sulfur domain-containing protein [Pseudonocardiaceae bacterium]